ncbi:MAG: hypothetical protein ACON4O_05970 [Lentimonas sp.]
MKSLKLLPLITLTLGSIATAAEVTIQNLDIRGTGVFGHDENAVLNDSKVELDETDVEAPYSLYWNITYSNLDLDGDGSANDTVTFQLNATSDNAALRGWGQGLDTGFGSLTDITMSVSNVSGTTTDSGGIIVFDGFTGGIIAGGSGTGDTDRFADVNGETLYLFGDNGGVWQFVQDGYWLSFDPVQELVYNNGGGTAGSLVARAHTLQFSVIFDTDEDGLGDGFENEYFGNLDQDGAGDPDSDGLTNAQEFTLGTDPTNADTSGDGVSDGDVVAAGFDPTVDYSFAQTGSGGGGLTLDQVRDLRPGSTMIEVAGGQASLTLTLEETSDVDDWSNATTTEHTISVDASEGSQFYRFKAAE